MRFCSLGSGSGGNATLVQASSGTTVSRILIDCGFSLKELERRLNRAGLGCGDLDAVFVTHEHGDHIGCALNLARRHGLALWMSRGTWEAIGEPTSVPTLQFARDLEAICVGDLELTPYTVPHDAHEPLQLRVSDGARRLGILTDAGSATPHLVSQLCAADALILECNHDRTMLAQSAYPPSVRARIGGRLGHLSNDLAAEILTQCMHPGLNHLVAAHLSERNNRPELARQALSRIWGANPCDVVVADPREGFSWIAMN